MKRDFFSRIVKTALLLFAAVALAGCDIAPVLPAAVLQTPEKTASAPPVIEQTAIATLTPKTTASPSPVPASQDKVFCDLDGDGLEDAVIAEAYGIDGGDPHATLTLTLGSGDVLVREFDGWWLAPLCETADFDGDGNGDILLQMGVGGSNYNATEVWVFRVSGGAIEEYANNIDVPVGVARDGREYTQFDPTNCVGAGVVYAGENALLRLRMLLDYDPGAGITTAHYVDLAWKGDTWVAEEICIGKAYGSDTVIEPDRANEDESVEKGDKGAGVKSENEMDMSLEDLAKWYFESSAYHDPQIKVTEVQIVPVDGDNSKVDHVRIHLESSFLYEVRIDEKTGALQSISGPYVRPMLLDRS